MKEQQQQKTKTKQTEVLRGTSEGCYSPRTQAHCKTETLS